MTKLKCTLLIAFSIASFQQLSAQEQADTTTEFFDGNWKKTEAKTYAYLSKRWKEGNNWHRNDYLATTQKLITSAQYADADCTQKNGLVKNYHESNGLIADSTFYNHGKKDGVEAGWYESGKSYYVNNYHNDIKVDTSRSWQENGKLSQLTVTDKDGNGSYKAFNDRGLLHAEGTYANGKRTGTWTFTDDNKIVSQIVTYENDSAITIVNYDEEGKKQKGKALLEIPAAFPGGLNGWRSYLEKNFRYPEISQKNGVQGVARVQMVVDQNGTLTKVKLLSSPDAYTGAEAVRVIRVGPNWIPAKQYNRNVTYRFVQIITFQLQ